jgi:hypothetical protein
VKSPLATIAVKEAGSLYTMSFTGNEGNVEVIARCSSRLFDMLMNESTNVASSSEKRCGLAIDSRSNCYL